MTKENLAIVKRISNRTIFILIGIGLTIGYLYLKRKELKFNRQAAWVEIPSGTAKDIMQKYQDEQEGIWLASYRLRTVDRNKKEQVLRGFWLDSMMLKDIQDAVFKEDPSIKINGYNVFFAKYDTADKRHYALVVRATQFVKKATGDDNEGVGPYFDFVDPCPDNCGGN
jgi:hypothetical protein